MITVPAESDMGAEVFMMHYNLRHMPCGGASKFPVTSYEDSASEALRVYHGKIHDEPGQAHKHKAARK
jgi:hypothetical protein